MKTALTAMALTGVALTACTTVDPNTGMTVRNNAGSGALIGALSGAALGYLTNTDDGDQGRKNALIGAGIGALGGAAVGNYMDRQQADLRRELANSGVTVSRNGDVITLSMPGDITFPVNRADIQPQFLPVLSDVGRTLNAYPATFVDVVGHADASGPDDLNQSLSEARARSVADFLVLQEKVLPRRLYVTGMGERSPIASNATPQGRAQNRRVEIVLRPFQG